MFLSSRVLKTDWFLSYLSAYRMVENKESAKIIRCNVQLKSRLNPLSLSHESDAKKRENRRNDELMRLIVTERRIESH